MFFKKAEGQNLNDITEFRKFSLKKKYFFVCLYYTPWGSMSILFFKKVFCFAFVLPISF